MALRGKLGRLGVAALAVAGLAAGSVFAVAPAHAQAPSSVPSARFYGHATFPNGNPPGTSISATVGGVACSVTVTATGGNSVGQLDNLGNYALDIQAVPGCTTPGASVSFSAGALRAQQTGTLPQIPGTAVHLDLTFAGAPTSTATPPPPPTRPAETATPRPATPPPPPPVTTTPRPATPVATTPRPVVTPRVQAPSVQAPKGPVVAQAPKAAQAPAYVAPAAPAAVAPRLPSTGTGGLLDQSASTSLTGWALALIVLAALGVSASGLVAYRRSR
jgi:hypothetical protein